MIDCVISILRSNNNYTRSRVFVEACLLKAFLDCFSPSTSKKPAKRGPKPKQIDTWDYCRTRGCFVYLNGIGQLSPSPKATENLFFLYSQTEDQSSRVCSHCSNQSSQVRSTRAGFSFINASFQESQHDDDSFRFLKTRISASPHGSAAW